MEASSSQRSKVAYRFDDVEAFLRSYCDDTTLRGIFLPTRQAVPVGMRFPLEIEIGQARVIEVSAEVVWRKDEPAGVGARFLQIAEADRVWLESQLADHAFAPQHLFRAPTSASRLQQPVDRVSQADVAAEREGLVLGIDLGTTNCSACVLVDGRLEMISVDVDEVNQKPAKTLPSVVAFDAMNQVTIGRKALPSLRTDPRRTVFGAKRFIGRAYTTPIVQQMLPRFPYRVVPDERGQVAVSINGRSIPLIEISATLLRAIRERATKRFRRPVERAIITVPAYYSDNQRDAVVQAGRAAGLTVERILNEPTAAALAYGLQHATPRRFLVYDLGGGTFDVSVMSVCRESIKVLATAGDTFLGGEDFDNEIVRLAIESHEAATGHRLSHNNVALVAIKEAAERVKKRLSSHGHATLGVREAVRLDGSTTTLEVKVTREQVEARVAPLVDRSLEICDLALEEAGLDALQLVDVILVGGQTLMPYVRERVRTHFFKTPRCDIDPTQAVALGVGMLASRAPQQGQQLRDVLSMSIGIGQEGKFKPVFRKNTPLPARKAFSLEIPREQLATYTLDAFQGESDKVSRNEPLGVLTLRGFDSGNEDPVPLAVDFILSVDGLLKIKVTHRTTGEGFDALLAGGV